MLPTVVIANMMPAGPAARFVSIKIRDFILSMGIVVYHII